MIYFIAQGRDAGRAIQMVRDLEAEGIEALLVRGPDLPALPSASGAVVLLSPLDRDSPHFTAQINAALDRDLPVLPVLIAPCTLPVALTDRVAADFTTSYDLGLTELLVKLSRIPPHAANEISTLNSPSGLLAGLAGRIPRAVRLGMTGAVIGLGAQTIVYAGDSRLLESFGETAFAVVTSLFVMGAAWTLTSLVAGRDRLAWTLSGIGAVAAAVAWVQVGGTYNDVVGAAIMVGASAGGFLGASIGRISSWVKPRIVKALSRSRHRDEEWDRDIPDVLLRLATRAA